MRYRLALLALLALALAGCGMDTQHTAALGRWQARQLTHYLLRTSEEVRDGACRLSRTIRR